MKNIVLLSDTHGFLDERFNPHLSSCDEIWHAGDIGENGVYEKLQKLAPTKAVFGNIDGHPLRFELPEWLSWKTEEVSILMTHIGGRPGNLSLPARELIQQYQPKLFICGHSHILLVKFDRSNNLLWLNPGACGNKGFHHMRTLLRFTIDNDKITNMEAIEIGKRSAAKQF
jgi:putative phosphoesterase